VKDTTTSTIDISPINTVQDDITDSVCTFVPRAAGLLNVRTIFFTSGFPGLDKVSYLLITRRLRVPGQVEQ
jgi:hypothetical protein